MTEDRLDYWATYAQQIIPTLRLMDWMITFQCEPTDDENHTAEIEPVYGRKLATIRFSKDWETLAPWKQRHAIVHELLHLHLTPIDNVFNRIMDGRSEGWIRLGREFHHEQVEYSVDILADIISQFVPFPPAIEPEREVAV